MPQVAHSGKEHSLEIAELVIKVKYPLYRVPLIERYFKTFKFYLKNIIPCNFIM